jgi:trans-L-3-hydroxyproline dehydratase
LVRFFASLWCASSQAINLRETTRGIKVNVRFERWPDRVTGWEPPAGWRRVLAVDAHTEGEPLRVIVAGFPDLAGDSMLDRRRAARARHDELRRSLMWEPRGHADMYGCIVGPPVTPEAHVGALFMHNGGFSTMCGHGIIGLATVLVECGLIEANGPEVRVGIDSPAGFIEARARVVLADVATDRTRADVGRPAATHARRGAHSVARAGTPGSRVTGVRFTNVPSFVAGLDLSVDVRGVGPVRYDLAYGGAFYAYVDATAVGLRLEAAEHDRIVDLGRRIKEAVQSAAPPVHPESEDLGFLYGTIFVGEAHDPDSHSRNVCVFADGEVDRSPTGTGVSGRLAIHHARGELAVGDAIRVESLLGTTFDGRVLRTARVGEHDAVIPEIEGRAFITGRNEILIDPEDPLACGFLLR